MQDGEQVTSPALTFETFCQSDRNAIYRTLTGIPELWVRVHQELPVKTQGTERVTMSRSAPVPPNLTADAMLREILAVLSSWDERVRMDAGLTLPDTQLSRQRRDPVVLTASVGLLTVHLDRLLALPADAMSRSFSLYDLAKIPEGAYGRSNRIAGYAEVTVDLSGADAGEEILRLSHRARSFLGETRMVETLDAPCPDPSCDSFTLEHIQGSAYQAECRNCGRLLSAEEYQMWVKLYVATVSTADLPPKVALCGCVRGEVEVGKLAEDLWCGSVVSPGCLYLRSKVTERPAADISAPAVRVAQVRAYTLVLGVIAGRGPLVAPVLAS